MRPDAAWQAEAVAGAYLDGVRGAIPLAAEQIDILVRLALAARPDARSILDLGCGDGILAHALLEAYSGAPAAVLADFSPPMLDAARARLGGRTANGAGNESGSGQHADGQADKQQASASVTYVNLDYAKPGWAASISAAPLPASYDVIVSGFSIHHQPDELKHRIYADIFDLLAPGGIFLNLEHVASTTRWGEERFEDYFIDALHRYHAPKGVSLNQVAADFYHRPDKAANLLSSVELQCQWLRELGFANVDCFFKVFELAIFGGMKPAADH